MLCTKCGHENPPSAKFCNQCGATADRRQGERRQGDRRRSSAADPQEGVASRRPTPLPSLTPGQENAQGHSPAVRAAESYLRRERPVRGPEQMPVEDARESGAPMSRGEVSGPSFLGLAGGSSDTADYLLEDESSGGWRKWAVLLVLVVIGVLFYLQWKNSWRAQPSPPPPAQTSPPPETAPQGKAAPPSEATGVPAAQTQQAANPPNTAVPQKNAQADPDASASPEKAKPDAAASAAAAPEKDKDNDEAAAADPSSGEQAAAEPEHKAGSRARDPAAGPASTRADAQQDPMVFMAQKYLYGNGVRKDCDQAMVYLRAANQKASVPARSQMGALYATGQCVPLDRVRAYQWFTSALNLDPGNAGLQHERNNLWAQMSSGERQQAVK